ncbi:hypothetical protein B0T10DRAFT_502143 [Thelonectria olida]|uniref:Peptidase C14 caspase domain-containing protein n=1 Tax=Thelonectria olida TaxID=1576542 RepID=A0A9P8VQH4_9HYPO|nr:hypothetical protein B0T10DRAFT_502143 [Thelonectria olida]
MKKVLEARGFNITECCGENATRDSIRTAWQNIIDKSSSGDTVVIFHSGHGGLVEARRKVDRRQRGSQQTSPISIPCAHRLR